MSLRCGLNGLPLGSQDARLYITRRFAGHDQPQPRVCPIPVGSELSRRAIRLPAGPQAPQEIQHPLSVLPSSRSSANPASCSPALRVTWVGVFGSVRSLSARPVYSLASSSGVGLFGAAYGHDRFTIGSA